MPGVDYVIPRIDFLIENKERVKAYILLHGHDDEIGALPFIYEEVPAPIYGSSVTLKLLEIFTLHVKKDIRYDLRPVKATDVFKIAGRKSDKEDFCREEDFLRCFCRRKKEKCEKGSAGTADRSGIAGTGEIKS